MIVMVMCIRGSTKDTKDTLPLSSLLVPTLVFTIVFGRYSSGDHGLLAELLYIFSNYMEGLAMLPQYIYCYHDNENRDVLVVAYMLAMGAYQMVFGLHWTCKLLFDWGYLDMSSLINGFLGVVFFADYVVFKRLDESPMSKLCITVDQNLREATDAGFSTLEKLRRTMSGELDFEMPKSPVFMAADKAEPAGKVIEVELVDAVRAPSSNS
jgi:hypothetical protein